MRPTIHLVGDRAAVDDLSAFDHFVVEGADHDKENPPPPRGIVGIVRVDPRAGSAEIKAALAAMAESAARAARDHPSVRHVILVADACAPLPGSFERVASSIATRHHARLERSAGRDIEFTVLSAAVADDALELADRLRERVAEAPGAHGVVVVQWADVRRCGIGRAAREQYF
jgi:hypothetical protein